MQTIASAVELKNAIQLLEAEQALKSQLLKEQLYFTYESLKPANLLRRTLRDITSSPDLIDDVLGTSVGLASGYLSKKIFVGSSENPIRKLLGALVQVGVSNVVTKHSETIKSILQAIFQFILTGMEKKRAASREK